MESAEEFIVWRTARPRELLYNGKVVPLPDNWVLIKSGDAGLTRRLKNCGAPYWVLVHKRRNRIEKCGLFMDKDVAEAVKVELEAERQTPEYQKQLASSRRSREKKQKIYEADFYQAVMDYLNFAPCYRDLAERFAGLVVEHAVPVGSGTVARTATIPIEQRAEAAVIAWMRHQTTAYDTMYIARIKGERRAVRRQLAAVSRKILERYVKGERIADDCPLYHALTQGAK